MGVPKVKVDNQRNRGVVLEKCHGDLSVMYVESSPFSKVRRGLTIEVYQSCTQNPVRAVVSIRPLFSSTTYTDLPYTANVRVYDCVQSVTVYVT